MTKASAKAFDVAIIGGGIAGIGLASALGPGKRVVLLEQESALGFHTTGRSAALYTQAYGNAAIRALTVASKPFFDRPPDGFAAYPLLTPRGVLLIGRKDQRAAVEREVAAAQKLTPRARLVENAEACALSPALKPDYVDAACYEPDAMDIDVDAMMQGYLASARKNGVDVWTDAGVQDLTQQNAGWRIETQKGAIEAGIIVNAAGAWASSIAMMAGAQSIKITPKRRTAFLVEAPTVPGFTQSAATIDVDEQFYFKPDAGLALISPADETPVEPHDAFPEEIDIAIGADRVQNAANIPIQRVAHSRAGLRSFADDKTPVVGFDQATPGFFWLAGQGGYGIQTSPAMNMVAAALINGHALPEALVQCAVDPGALSPLRFSSNETR
jgi:D-arginine dehydrogenase